MAEPNRRINDTNGNKILSDSLGSLYTTLQDSTGNGIGINSVGAVYVNDRGFDVYSQTVTKKYSMEGHNVVLSQEEFYIERAQSWRFEQALDLDQDESKYYVSITPSIPTQCFLRVKLNSLFETNYKVYVQPTLAFTGTAVNAASKNPHYQFIGQATTTFLFFEDPSFTSSGTRIRNQIWGSGTKRGGSSDPGEYTILSPNQTLLYEVESIVNGNHIDAEWHVEERIQADPTTTALP